MAKRKKLTEDEYAVQNVCPVLAIITVREKKRFHFPRNNVFLLHVNILLLCQLSFYYITLATLYYTL